jgi:ribosomal silencing factor RsfS
MKRQYTWDFHIFEGRSEVQVQDTICLNLKHEELQAAVEANNAAEWRLIDAAGNKI